MKLKKPKVNIILIIALAVGLIVSGYSYIKISQNIADAKASVEIAVPKRDIPRYQKITPSDLEYRSFPSKERDGIAATKAEITDKYTLADLYEGELINKNRITSKNIMEGYNFTCVNVNLATSSGAVPGNVVDVYKLNAGSQNKIKVAENAIVVNVWDGQGNSVYKESGGLVKAFKSGNPPAVIRLAVKPSDTSKIVGGATPGEINVELVIKNNRKGVNFNAETTRENTGQDKGTGNGGRSAGTNTGETQDS